MQKKYTKILLIAGAWFLTIFIGFFLGKQLATYFLPPKNEEHSQIIHSIKPIAKISTYKINRIEELHWSNQSNPNEGFNLLISKLANFFYVKNLYLQIPISATYGYDLDSTNFSLVIENDTLIFNLPKPKLLNFELLWNEKKTFSEKGWLVFENDHQFDDLEKLFYEQKKKAYENNDTALKKSKEIFENQFNRFYSKLGYNLKIYEIVK